MAVVVSLVWRDWVGEFFAGVWIDETGEELFCVAAVLDDDFERERAWAGAVLEGLFDLASRARHESVALVKTFASRIVV
jgi:hypothetical protein